MGTKPLEESDLLELSRYVGGNWEHLAYTLDISKTDIDCIKVDYRYSVQDQIFRMLLDWKQSAEKKVTIEDFLNKTGHTTEEQKTKKIKVNMEKLERLIKRIGLCIINFIL